jgi:hypothetical protein
MIPQQISKQVSHLAFRNSKHLLGNPLASFDNSTIFKENEHKTCLNKNIRISSQKHMFTNIFFPDAETLFMDDCNKEFVFYNFRKHIFPRIETLFINCNPGKFDTLHRFADKEEYNVFITSDLYKKFSGKWWDKNIDYIKEISHDNYSEVLNSFCEVEPTFQPTFKEPRTPNLSINPKYFD